MSLIKAYAARSFKGAGLGLSVGRKEEKLLFPDLETAVPRVDSRGGIFICVALCMAIWYVSFSFLMAEKACKEAEDETCHDQSDCVRRRGTLRKGLEPKPLESNDATPQRRSDDRALLASQLRILRETFGYDTFRPLQQEVIENVLARRDTLAIMPTGGGKSLCYQIPALLFEGLTVVVSPLISLMKDQVEQLRAIGIPALFLNSSLAPEDYRDNMESVKRGAVKLLYLAPETLLTPRILSMLAGLRVDCLTIDEAHCISEWGHDFRPEYRQLVEVRRQFPKAVCLALTATATERVRKDIRSTLKFATSQEFVASFDRENLYLEVTPKHDPVAQTIRMLERHRDESGIIYCFSRRQVDELAADLAAKGYAVRRYHAGLEDSGATPEPGGVHPRRCADHRRHHRVRHGHQQTQCALRHSLRPSQKHRRLLPGDRACRARWLAGALPAAL